MFTYFGLNVHSWFPFFKNGKTPTGFAIVRAEHDFLISFLIQVENVIIYQERQSEDDDAEIVVKIFVEFENAAQAKAAKGTLHGRSVFVESSFSNGKLTCTFSGQKNFVQ